MTLNDLEHQNRGFYGFYICSQWAFIHALLSRVPFALAWLSCSALRICRSLKLPLRVLSISSDWHQLNFVHVVQVVDVLVLFCWRSHDTPKLRRETCHAERPATKYRERRYWRQSSQLTVASSAIRRSILCMHWRCSDVSIPSSDPWRVTCRYWARKNERRRRDRTDRRVRLADFDGGRMKKDSKAKVKLDYIIVRSPRRRKLPFVPQFIEANKLGRQCQ